MNTDDQSHLPFPPGHSNREHRPPFQRGSATSEAAAEAIKPVAAQSRRRVLEKFADFGVGGATRQEISIQLGMAGDTVRPRVLELLDIGAIFRSCHTRKTNSGRDAEILCITKAGAAMLAMSGGE